MKNFLFIAVLIAAESASSACTKPVAIERPVRYHSSDYSSDHSSYRSSYHSPDHSQPYQPHLDQQVVAGILKSLGCGVVSANSRNLKKKTATHTMLLYEDRAASGIPAGYEGVWLRNRVYGLLSANGDIITKLSSASNMTSNMSSLLLLQNFKLSMSPDSRYGLTLRRMYRSLGKTQNILFNQSLERRIRLLAEGKVQLIFDDLLESHRLNGLMGQPSRLVSLPFFRAIEPIYLIAAKPAHPELAAVFSHIKQQRGMIRGAYLGRLKSIVPASTKGKSGGQNSQLLRLIVTPQ